jgi:hypothetical protein
MERRGLLRSRKLIAALMVGALLILTGIAWLERTPLLVFYFVHRLQGANESDRQSWVERVAALDFVAIPQLIDCLRRADPRVCANAQACLLKMVQRWGLGDLRRVQLAECLALRFATLSEQGGQMALEIQEHLLRTSETDTSGLDLLPAVTRTLAEASLTANTEVHTRALALAASLTERGAGPELLSACRKLTLTCLGGETAANRMRAIRLASRSEIGLLEAVVPLLSDPIPEVRRAAMLGVGSAPNAINTDDLLPWLHDPDPSVRSLCENALRCRGLQDEHIKLGRLMSDSRPGVRLQVVDRLRRVHDLEPSVWLRQLSHDSVPAVRAAAVRAAAEQGAISLKDRLEQMAQNDPCPSVRQLAQYYLTTQ